MGRVNIEEELEKEGFHPCLNCGGDEFSMDWERGLYVCDWCDEAMKSPPMKKEKVRLPKITKGNWDDEI